MIDKAQSVRIKLTALPRQAADSSPPERALPRRLEVIAHDRAKSDDAELETLPILATAEADGLAQPAADAQVLSWCAVASVAAALFANAS